MDTTRSLDFIRAIIAEDVRSGRNGGRVITRFPPEPNGYLHIGHAKSITLNFGLAREFADAPGGSRCHLRFDDTNPVKEEQAYIDAIKRDIRWLGFDWGEHEYYASDYFEPLHEWAVLLIRAGKAFVCDLGPEDVREYRGTLTQPGRESPYRNRSVEENFDLFERMRNGKFPDGSRTLRAKIDMAAPNLNLRDPVMYRILHARHHRTGDTWCIYPMYDWAHGQSDWIEGITHSICTLEFEAHRPLYEWYIEQIAAAGGGPRWAREHGLPARAHGDASRDPARAGSPCSGLSYRPRQIEFARLNLEYTMMSKRRLLALVEEGHVTGWDDPRMPTVSAMRRRGYPPEAIRTFVEAVGVAKRENVIELSRLEFEVRENLNRSAPRVMAVLHPLRIVIENYPKGQSESVDAVNNPEDASAGTRPVPFSRILYIERDDFMEEPPAKFFRLAPGREVRLRYAYFITCREVVKDEQGEVVELRCTYDPATHGGDAPDGRKVKATLHWVSAEHALDAEVRLYDRLFTKEDPGDVPEGGDWRDNLNPDSLHIVAQAKVEPSLKSARPGDLYQFERLGYFCLDDDSSPDRLTFNRTVTLKDSWAKVKGKA